MKPSITDNVLHTLISEHGLVAFDVAGDTEKQHPIPINHEAEIATLQLLIENLAKLPDLNGAHIIDIIIEQDGYEGRYQADWLKTLKQPQHDPQEGAVIVNAAPMGL